MHPVYGRWDLTVDLTGDRFPSWVEIGEGGGQFVGRFGSARPLGKVHIDGDRFSFELPPQYEGRKDAMVFEGQGVLGSLIGTTRLDDGRIGTWVGARAPHLMYSTPEWDTPINMIRSDLANWHPRGRTDENKWAIVGGELVNQDRGADLIGNDAFRDFRLVSEYRYPKGSNSGIYLRGRYELQIYDDFDGAPHGVGNSGAIYGFLAPTHNAIRRHDETNRIEIELVGRFVSVRLNDALVIDKKEIPGITGGALDSAEGQPGPIFLQGDHGPVTFSKLTIAPRRTGSAE